MPDTPELAVPVSAARKTVPPYQLFQRKGSAKWWVRFSIKGEPQIRKTLETTDRAEAEQKAQEVWFEAKYRARQGLRSQTRPFKKVADEFLIHMKTAVERGEQSKRRTYEWALKIKRYMSDFFGEKAIDAIGQPEISRYLEWGRNYWISGPGKDVKEMGIIYFTPLIRARGQNALIIIN